MTRERTESAQIFRALGDPVRLSIVRQIADTQELACSALEDTLPVSKPTISYHTKILRQAGVINVHKRGRNYFYSLRRETLGELIDALKGLAPGPRPVVGDTQSHRRTKRSQPPVGEPAPLKLASGDDAAQTTPLLTW